MEKVGRKVQNQFKQALEKRLENPCIKKHKLSGWPNVYKIKLRSAGYRLVYEVDNNEVVVLVLSVGKRENNLVYKKLLKRIK